MTIHKLTFVLIVILLLSASSFAHEYWFEPESFFLNVGEKTPVHLFVGDGLVKDKEERFYQSKITLMFQLFGVNKVWDLKKYATEGQEPVSTFSAEKNGTFLIAMERSWSYIKLEPKKFEDYLQEDGMGYISAERKTLGESDKEGRERYCRFLKSLVQVGDKKDNTYRKKLGLKLEIVPLENPYKKKPGDTFAFRIFFEGKPLANRTVFADNRSTETRYFKTDNNGKAIFVLDKKGMWLIRLVNMQRCLSDCKEADWESYWAALTFAL